MRVNGENMKKLMERKLFNDRMLAEALGMGVATVNKIRNERTEPQAETLRKICAVLECKPAEILREDDTQ